MKSLIIGIPSKLEGEAYQHRADQPTTQEHIARQQEILATGD